MGIQDNTRHGETAMSQAPRIVGVTGGALGLSALALAFGVCSIAVHGRPPRAMSRSSAACAGWSGLRPLSSLRSTLHPSHRASSYEHA